VARTPEDAPDRQAEVAREIIGLIEATMHRAPWVQGHRHHGVGVGQDVGAGCRHEGRQRGRERPTPLELEGVNGGAQRARVNAGAARRFEARRSFQAPQADPEGPGGRRERIPAEIA